MIDGYLQDQSRRLSRDTIKTTANCWWTTSSNLHRRSSVVLPQTLASRGDARAQADYLMHFRADSIVKDAESIRRELVGEEVPWSVLGQSYGGFCAVTYLSLHPEGLREVFITGGLPPTSKE
jgi:pimeloyl-ACP methyl ester carboxylesterase